MILFKVDNSQGGVKIPDGTSIEMKFRIGETDVKLKGNVCREDKAEACFAIKFEDMEPDIQSMLKNFINESIEIIKNQQ